jgi:hypothetical protein
MPRKRPVPPADGSQQALDQAANWVRFADTKATVLTAALGVVMTMLVANTPHIIKAAAVSEEVTTRFGILAFVVAAAFLFTLGWLVHAIVPRRSAAGRTNRFSWPALASTDYEDLVSHNAAVPAHEDAWRQTLVLARVADEKFRACRVAAYGFAVFIVSAVVCVVAAALVNG